MTDAPMIDKFDGEYAFLSNFYPSMVKLYGLDYPTVEHAFQAAKTLDLSEREAIRLASTPGRAKRLGRRATLRCDWEDRKLGFMETLLRRKFDYGSDLWQRLRATAPAELVEGNTWGDVFWGAVPFGRRWTPDQHYWAGQNHLGKLLMKIRDEEVS